MYILVKEQAENGAQFGLHDVRTGKNVDCRVDFSALSCRDLVIQNGFLFANHLETRTVKVFEISTGSEIETIQLNDVLGLTVADGEIYAWNFDEEVFSVDRDGKGVNLKKMITSRKDMNFLKVIRNTEEKFTAAMETFDGEVCLISKIEEVTRINVVKASGHRLLGATKKHLYLFAEDTNDIVDYHNGEFATLFNADADSDFCWWRSRVCCGKMYAFYTEFQLKPPTGTGESSDESRSDDDDSEAREHWKLEVIETESGFRRILNLGCAAEMWHVCATDTC